MRISMHFQMKRYRNGLTGSLQGMHNMASVCGQLYSRKMKSLSGNADLQCSLVTAERFLR